MKFRRSHNAELTEELPKEEWWIWGKRVKSTGEQSPPHGRPLSPCLRTGLQPLAEPFLWKASTPWTMHLLLKCSPSSLKMRTAGESGTLLLLMQPDLPLHKQAVHWANRNGMTKGRTSYRPSVRCHQEAQSDISHWFSSLTKSAQYVSQLCQSEAILLLSTLHHLALIKKKSR